MDETPEAAPDPYRPPLARVPAPIIGVVGGLAMGLVIAGLCLFAGTSGSRAGFGGVAGAIVLGLGYGLLAAWAKRQKVSPRALLGWRLQRAMRTGVRPEGVDGERAVAWADDSRRFWIRLTIVSAILSGVFAVGILAVLIFGARPPEWRTWVETVLFVGWFVYSVLQGRHQLARLDRLRALLT